MKIKIIVTVVALFAGLLSTDVAAQNEKEKMDVDTYIATGKSIIIAKILSVSPVTRAGYYHAKVEVLHVVKGEIKNREISLSFNWTQVEAGKIYLLRSEKRQAPDDIRYFDVKGRHSAIEIAPYTNIEEMKTLCARITVLRVMNLRKYHLENEIRQFTSELENLNQITKEQ